MTSSPSPSPLTSEAGTCDDDVHVSKHSNEEYEDGVEDSAEVPLSRQSEQDDDDNGDAEVGNGDENQGGSSESTATMSAMQARKEKLAKLRARMVCSLLFLVHSCG